MKETNMDINANFDYIVENNRTIKLYRTEAIEMLEEYSERKEELLFDRYAYADEELDARAEAESVQKLITKLEKLLADENYDFIEVPEDEWESDWNVPEGGPRATLYEDEYSRGVVMEYFPCVSPLNDWHAELKKVRNKIMRKLLKREGGAVAALSFDQCHMTDLDDFTNLSSFAVHIFLFADEDLESLVDEISQYVSQNTTFQKGDSFNVDGCLGWDALSFIRHNFIWIDRMVARNDTVNLYGASNEEQKYLSQEITAQCAGYQKTDLFGLPFEKLLDDWGFANIRYEEGNDAAS